MVGVRGGVCGGRSVGVASSTGHSWSVFGSSDVRTGHSISVLVEEFSPAICSSCVAVLLDVAASSASPRLLLLLPPSPFFPCCFLLSVSSLLRALSSPWWSAAGCTIGAAGFA